MKSIHIRASRAATAVLLFGLCAFALPVQATEVKKPEFTVTVPDDWREIPKNELERYNNFLVKVAAGRHVPHFDYGFQPGSTKRWLAYPHMLVRINTQGRIPESELKKYKAVDLNKEVAKRRKHLSSLLSQVFAGGATVYDTSTHTLWKTLRSTVKGPAKLAVMVIVPMHDGYLIFSGYTKQANFAKNFPQFRSIVSSVVIPKGNRY